jgi:hypothetical protein
LPELNLAFAQTRFRHDHHIHYFGALTFAHGGPALTSGWSESQRKLPNSLLDFAQSCRIN